jgi:hypothetical protein
VRHPVVRLERAEQGKPGLRAVHHGQGDRAAERDQWSRRHLAEHLVQRENLRPVRLLGGRSLVVHRGNRRLELVRTDRDGAQGPGDQRHAFGDRSSVPELPALLGERHDRPVDVGPGRPACVGQQHQREQPGDLALARQQAVQQTREPDGLGGQVDPLQRRPRAGRVPFIEDEVEHMQDHAEPLGWLGW